MTVPDYYAILSISSTATPQEIKQAYRVASLRTHPDRLPNSATKLERDAANEKFSSVADAYFTLSDPARRKSYDQLLATNKTSNASPFSFFDFFGQKPNAEHVFTDEFENLLRPEIAASGSLYRIVGAAAGIMLGFIVGNVPGSVAGGLAGSKLGSMRDAHGKSLYDVYTSLEPNQKAEVLKGLAAKVFGLASNHLS